MSLNDCFIRIDEQKVTFFDVILVNEPLKFCVTPSSALHIQSGQRTSSLKVWNIYEHVIDADAYLCKGRCCWTYQTLSVVMFYIRVSICDRFDCFLSLWAITS